MAHSLNDTLMKVSSMKTQTCCMRLPSSGQNSRSFRFKLLLQNTTEVPLTMSIARVKNCKCQSVNVGSISRRLQVYNCPHKNEIHATLSTDKLKPCKKAVLTFDVNYDEPQDEPFKFVLTIGTTEPPNLKTKVRLLLTRPIIPMVDPRLDLSIPPIRLKTASTPDDRQSVDSRISDHSNYRWVLEPLCVNENSKYIQILWIMNESVSDIHYSAEWKSVDHKIFHIINPTGIAQSSSNHPLLLMCSPCEFADYSAELIIKCHHNSEEFHVRVELSVATNAVYDTRRMLNKMPFKTLFDQSEMSLELSVDHMCLPPIPTHSYVRRIFFIKNHSTDTLKFEWLKCSIWSVLEAIVWPTQGILQPQEVCSCMVQIQTFRLSAKCCFFLSCLVINLSKCQVYWASTKFNKRASHLFDACFTLRNSTDVDVLNSFKNTEYKPTEKPQSHFESLGFSVHIFNGNQIEFICPPAKEQLEFTPNIKADIYSPPKNVLTVKSPEVPDLILDVIRTAISQILKSAPFKLTYNNTTPHVVKYASPINQTVENLLKTLQGYHMSSLVSRAVYESVTDFFGLPSRVDLESPDKMIEVTKLYDQSNFTLNNWYYHDILNGNFLQVKSILTKQKTESIESVESSQEEPSSDN